ncbi:MAG: hypothetical protein JNN15_06190, partial [Blastocatellia bacterium]|nr:hypothetical protein [Blastocatellia bacterium]
MKAMQELVVGWESAIETLKQTSDAKLSDLMYSIHTAFLEALSIGIFPQVPFDYSKFILSMKSFFSDPRLKEVVTDISASFELNLVVRDYVKLTFFNGKEGVELLEQIEKEDDFTGTILDLANRHIVSQFRQTDIDYLFVIKTLNRWASNKDFLKAL